VSVQHRNTRVFTAQERQYTLQPEQLGVVVVPDQILVVDTPLSKLGVDGSYNPSASFRVSGTVADCRELFPFIFFVKGVNTFVPSIKSRHFVAVVCIETIVRERELVVFFRGGLEKCWYVKYPPFIPRRYESLMNKKSVWSIEIL
jgi:hypothetical protein